MTRRDQPPFVPAPGPARQEIRNPERIVGRWLAACAILTTILVMTGVIP